MKKTGKLVCLIMAGLLLTGCNDSEVERLEDQVDHLEEKIDALLEQNNISTPSTGNTNNTVTNDGEGTTTVDTSEISSTISGYNNEAEDIQNSIDNLTIPNSRSETIDLYWEWKRNIEELENKLDRYENELERMYRNNELSYTDYRTFDRQIEDIENILDRAEDELEYQTNYDD